MAIMLPGDVSYLLNMLGFEWPEGNEDKIFAYAGEWMAYAAAVDGPRGTAASAAEHATANNTGPALQAFAAELAQPEGVKEVAEQLAMAGNVAGGVLLLVGALVIALKIAFVVNLVLLAIQIAQAVAAAAATFGASLAWIPIARVICARLLEFALNMVVEKLMAG
ncbi:hypothetical protein ACQCX2_09540 [Propionibacteriaceae bacterium Y1700]|uniref:WXG100-like domain-containing protein n=1 Tax=Microlunatus sp. Y1700 TaxID=3418487 RepID=UPI003DA78B55